MNMMAADMMDGSAWQRSWREHPGKTGRCSQQDDRRTGRIDRSRKNRCRVHAYEQVANFHTNSNMKCWEMKYYLNRYLPGDIAVNRVDDVPERFHSRYNAKAKKYLYRIAIGDVPCVFDRKYTWYCFDKLDVTAMKKAAALLVGEHDFKAFCSNKRTKQIYCS